MDASVLVHFLWQSTTFSGEAFVDCHAEMHFMSPKANGMLVTEFKFSFPQPRGTRVKLGGWIFRVSCYVTEFAGGRVGGRGG